MLFLMIVILSMLISCKTQMKNANGRLSLAPFRCRYKKSDSDPEKFPPACPIWSIGMVKIPDIG